MTPGTGAVVGIGATRRTGGVRAGKIEAVERDLQPLLLALRAQAPAGLGLEQVERDFGDREDRRQGQLRLAGIEQQLAAALAQVDLARQAFGAGEIRLRSQAEAVERSLQRVTPQILVVQGPAGFQLADPALRLIGLQQLAGGRVERHVASQLRQRAEIEEAGAGPSLDRAAGSIVAPVEAEIAGRDAQPVGGLQLDPLAGQRPLAGPVARLDPAAQTGQVEFRQFRREADTQFLKRQVGRQPATAVAHFAPKPQGAATVRQMYRVIDPALPAGQVGIVELHVEARREVGELPRLQGLQQVALELAAQVEAVGEGARRHRREPEAMAVAAIVEAEIDVFENQRRRLPLAVVPDQRGVADANPRLRQQPFERSRVALAGGIEAGDRNPPIDSRAGRAAPGFRKPAAPA